MSEAKPIRFPVFRKRFLKLKGNMTTVAFAKKLGLTRATVGFYEAGERIPDALGIARIAKACKVSTDYLLGLSDVQTTDTDLKSVCEYTGLSENAVKVLNETKDNPIYMGINDTVNLLLLEFYNGKVARQPILTSIMAYLAMESNTGKVIINGDGSVYPLKNTPDGLYEMSDGTKVDIPTLFRAGKIVTEQSSLIEMYFLELRNGLNSLRKVYHGDKM